MAFTLPSAANPRSEAATSRHRRQISTADVPTTREGTAGTPRIPLDAISGGDGGAGEILGELASDIGERQQKRELAEFQLEQKIAARKEAALIAQSKGGLKQYLATVRQEATTSDDKFQEGFAEQLGGLAQQRWQELRDQITSPLGQAEYDKQTAADMSQFAVDVGSDIFGAQQKVQEDNANTGFAELAAAINAGTVEFEEVGVKDGSVDKIMSLFAPGATPDQVRDTRRAGMAIAAKARINRFFRERDFEGARAFLNRSDVDHLITPDEQTSFNQTIREQINGPIQTIGKNEILYKDYLALSQKRKDIFHGIEDTDPLVLGSEGKRMPKGVLDDMSMEEVYAFKGITDDQKIIMNLPREEFLELSEEHQRSALYAQPSDRTIKGYPEDVWFALPEETRKKIQEGRPLVEVTTKQKASEKLATGLVERDLKRTTEAQGKAELAHGKLVQIEQMRSALSSGNFETGIFGESRLQVSRLAEFLGVPGDNPIMKLLGDAKTGEVLDSATNQLMALASKDTASRTKLSQQFIQNSFPKLMRTISGNQIIADVMERVAQREILKAETMDDFLVEHGALNPREKGEDGKRTPSFDKAWAKFERSNPVIDEEMKARIKAAAKVAPKSFDEAFGQNPPEGVPKGSRPNGEITPDGETVWVASDGQKYAVAPGAD
jgi:hypothetical protein